MMKHIPQVRQGMYCRWVGRSIVSIVPAQGKELYAAVCSLQLAGQGEKKRKEWFASRHSTSELGANWRRR